MLVIPKLCSLGSHGILLVFQTATKLLRQIVIKLFQPNCLINGSVRYLFWPRGAVNNCRGTKGAMNRECLGTAAICHESV